MEPEGSLLYSEDPKFNPILSHLNRVYIVTK
jgi:hypothetical protein